MSVSNVRVGTATVSRESSYEWKAVTLLGLSFGLLGLDRWILAPIFPSMMNDLHLSYVDLGNASGILAITWGISSIAMGRLSDRIGRRRVLIPALLVFSLLSGLTGFANGIASLIILRGIMGVAEGAFCPVSIATTSEAAAPQRRGLVLGLQACSFALLGFGFAPIIATQLLRVLPSWREVFMIVGIPGLILAALMYRVIREPTDRDTKLASVSRTPLAWKDVIRSRNVVVATFGMLCAISCVFVLGTMVPTYLINHLKLDSLTMGVVMSAIGWGGFLGDFGICFLSDYIGRRNAAVLAFCGTLIAVWIFAHTPASPPLLFIGLLFTAFFGFGIIAVITGPIACESVPETDISSAVGIISGSAEIFGGGVAPIVTGYVAQQAGIQNIFWLPIVVLALGFFIMMALTETAPRYRTRLN